MSGNGLKNNSSSPQVKNAPIGLRTGFLNSVFCVFFSLGLPVKNGQLHTEIFLIFLSCLNLLKCPINKKLLPRVKAHISE
jgi:hypothetical protein